MGAPGNHMPDCDVLIIGAGLSGIGAAVHLARDCPDRSFLIIEGRAAIGGTWDLFRYPGIRSDSDMYTLGYDFKPWTAPKAIADGDTIRDYVQGTADEHDLTRRIRFGHRAVAAAWDSASACWTVQIDLADGGNTSIVCRFLYLCSGYYSYEKGHRPDFPGEADFAGTIVHPQFWPEALDYAGKQVVIIGSGATAVTLVPAMADAAAHVTMLQRSPSYVVSRPAKDAVADVLRRLLPQHLAYRLIRWKNIVFQQLFYGLTRRDPARAKRELLSRVQAELGPDYDVGTHFTPRYNPWDQRLCLVPDGDLFKALKAGKASVVTDRIERFEAGGIRLASGQLLPADVIVTATGLQLLAMGGMRLSVDGQPVQAGEHLSYKGVMLSHVPNLAVSMGYINASWTLRSDLIARWVAKLLNHMQAKGRQIATPVPAADVVPGKLSWDLASGYVERSANMVPRAGNRQPWLVTANYRIDRKELLDAPMEDPELVLRSIAIAQKKPAYRNQIRSHRP